MRLLRDVFRLLRAWWRCDRIRVARRSADPARLDQAREGVRRAGLFPQAP